MSSKICPKCCIEKSLDQYGIDKSCKDGYRYVCKECANARQRKYAVENKELIRARNESKVESRKAYYQSQAGIRSSRKAHLKRAFNMKIETYEQMLENQEGKCAICRKEERGVRNSFLAIDHNHSTGEIRGLLCSHCNRAIGLLEENKINFTNAIKYLEKYESI